MLHLTFPDISYKSRYLEMIAEWSSFETTPTSPSALFRGETFEEFIEITEKNKEANSLGVPATLFFFMEDDEILGAIQVHHHINHPRLSLEGGGGGHIGYGLRPSARGKGLAKEMLKLALQEAHKIGMDRVLISADEDNHASWKTIESCEGIYHSTIMKDDKPLKTYWVDLGK